MACGKNAYVVSDVDLAVAQENREIGGRRTRFTSLMVRSLPPGVVGRVKFGNKQDFPVLAGEAFEFEPEEDGIFFSWSPNAPGQYAKFVMGVSDGDGTGIVRTA